ncbi:glycine cleavage system protein GcvH [Candidatus Microthrix parvicella]|jgi:glycine cleavage system H protein|uniref:Glycine cleavage system H protein n=1 Tax=Candidatus Neomicrothrix parvicella RN1 TaxID=1229780 RepID=R4Z166_9ACTN|nr:glycine cleavage system protein GcvH [Candidatus Microthrix parvicella]CCM64468.1 putative glycine cleavage system protein H [Candidatus Microthrix parvicella RN1]
MDVPDDLNYSADHEWIKAGDDGSRVGITDYAQDALGDVVFVELPEVGTTVAAGDKVAEVESTKSVSDIYAPMNGTVVAVNDDLDDTPELVNSDPYGEGWFMVIETTEAAGDMLDAAAYRKLTEG